MASVDKNQIWHDLLESIKVSVSSAIFSTWFTQTHLVSLKKMGKRYLAEIGCSSSYVKSTVESRYFGLIQDTLSKILGIPCDLVFIVKQTQAKSEAIETPSPLFEEKKD